MQDFIWHLIAASFLFTGAGFAWSWSLYLILVKKIEVVWVRVTNHQEHEIDELKERISRLENDR
jgi:hypothetical protein